MKYKNKHRLESYQKIGLFDIFDKPTTRREAVELAEFHNLGLNTDQVFNFIKYHLSIGVLRVVPKTEMLEEYNIFDLPKINGNRIMKFYQVVEK